MNTATVKYPTGQLTLYLDEFFPAPLSKVKKIIKLIQQDYEWTPENTISLVHYLDNRIHDNEKAITKLICNAERESEIAQTYKYQAKKRTSKEYKEFMLHRDRYQEQLRQIRQLKSDNKTLQATWYLFAEVFPNDK